MSESEKSEIETFMTSLPDTLFLKSSTMMPLSKNKKFYALTSIHIKNLKDKPLANEVTIITGLTSKKSIETMTNKKGALQLYLPKGDTYTINFIYNKASTQEVIGLHHFMQYTSSNIVNFYRNSKP
jgi:hypothetical protein